MHYIFSGPNRQYASAAVSERHTGDKSVHTPATYLGKIIDLPNGIFQSKQRGLFRFDIQTGEYSDVPDDFVLPEPAAKKGVDRRSLDFGDVYFLDCFFWQSGLNKVIDAIAWSNKDTIYSLICFYILSTMANCDCDIWYAGNIATRIYPNANLTSQRISDCLAAIGSRDVKVNFLEAWSSFVIENYCPDKNILVDSSGLPNKVHMEETKTSVHNNVVSNETRLICVVQKSTGLPLFYESVPGNMVDKTTLESVFAHLGAMHIDIDSCILDAGYDTGSNLDIFYEDHVCQIGYITRAVSSDKRLKEMIEEYADTIDSGENLVKFEDRYLFIVKKEIMVGTNSDNPGWMYLGYDISRANDETRKLMKRAKKKKLTNEEVYEALQSEGYFAIISGREYGVEEILPAYYERQQIEQTFDIMKNYTKILPIRNRTPETYRGHLLISFVASCVMKMIQLGLKTAEMLLGSKIIALRNEKCTVYADRIVPDPLYPEARPLFETFKIPYPASIPIRDGKLQYKHPEPVLMPQPTAKKEKKSANKRKRGRPPGSKNKKTLEREAQLAAQAKENSGKLIVEKRKPGRPKGSKNKKTLEREAMMAAQAQTTEKRKPGRPKGSKNKKTLEREAAAKKLSQY